MDNKSCINNSVINTIFQSSSVEECKTLFRRAVEGSRLNVNLKAHMVRTMDRLNSLLDCQKYAMNSMLKYNGLGTIQPEIK